MFRYAIFDFDGTLADTVLSIAEGANIALRRLGLPERDLAYVRRSIGCGATQLCIRQLKKYITPETLLLDVGTGSGILAIVSLMYGIKGAVGTDLDPCAVEAVRENMEVNGVASDSFEMMIGNIISDKEIQERVGYDKYDIVVANILAEVLLPLTPVVKQHLKKGGIYITSGIIAEKEQLVTDAIKAAGMEVLEVTRQNEWVSVTARR